MLIKQDQKLKEILKQVPDEPGCYLMLDEEERILYIGKSKSLKSRVKSYFQKSNDLSPRIKLMIRQINDIEFIVTDTENEALTLESNLIKEKQPYFNVLLKDDKKYPYLCITWSDDYPRIYITRRRRTRNYGDKYYGPFVDVGLLRKTLFLVKRVFPLRQRTRPLYKDRTCLNYPIGRCPGVCQEKISPEEYKKIIKKVEMVFQGRSDELQNLLKKQMFHHSNNQDYESAALIRDQISAIDQLHQEQKMISPDSTISRDVVALSSDEKIAAIQFFQMRTGKLVGRIGYTADAKSLTKTNILQRVIEEHYSQVDSVEIPQEILVQDKLDKQDIIANWLSDLRGGKVSIKSPLRSKKADLLKLVERNSEYELKRLKNGYEKIELSMLDLCEILDLNTIPRRIEGYDISHISGSDAVGSQVVFINGIPAKQHYRKYIIKNINIMSGHSDDFLALSEVISRRFRKWSKLKKEVGNIDTYKTNISSKFDNSGFNDWPDLVMIDGGKGQLSSVLEIIKSLDLQDDLNICSLAKKKEEIFIPLNNKPVDCNPDDFGVLLLRKVRDEAHRFAISFHRKKRSSRMTKSRLATIPGIGPKSIRDLLAYFNSVDAIQLATKKELMNVSGLGESKALIIWNYFHP